MSVSPEKNSENIRDRGKSRYDSPTLRSFQLYPANLRCTDLVLTTERRPGSPFTLVSFLVLGWRDPRAQPRPPS